MKSASSQEQLIIDRFEGDWAVIEYGRLTFNFPRQLLPSGTKEGDVLNVSVALDEEKTHQRKKQIDKMMNDLFED